MTNIIQIYVVNYEQTLNELPFSQFKVKSLNH